MIGKEVTGLKTPVFVKAFEIPAPVNTVSAPIKTNADASSQRGQ